MEYTQKTIVLVGLMGAGKSRIGVELARLMRRPFVDADREIERAAGLPIPDIFEKFGEAEFRKGEKKVMLRLLEQGGQVLASGGGAFMQPEIRNAIKDKAISVWLRAEVNTLVERTSRTNHRPLLRGIDKKEKLQQLAEVRYPVYAEADYTVSTDGQSPQAMAKIIRDLLREGAL